MTISASAGIGRPVTGPFTTRYGAPRAPFVAVLPAVLAGRDVEPEARLVVDHHAIRPQVDPVLIGIDGHIEAAGAEVAAAVELVPFRGGEDRAVDLIATENVLEDRAVPHHLGRDRRDALAHALLPLPHQLVRRGVDRKAERDGDARERAEAVREHAEALLVAGDLVEDRGLRGTRAAQELRRHADVLFGVRPGDDLELADLVHLLQPLAKIRGRLRLGADRGGLGVPPARSLRRRMYAPARAVST